MTSWDGGTLDEREYLIVRGTVQQIVYYNDENGYAVLRLAAEKRSRGHGDRHVSQHWTG